MIPMPNVEVVHNGTSCDLLVHRYGSGQIALALRDSSDGERYCTATVNLPTDRMDADEVAVKNYSENAGVLDALTAAGVVGPPVRHISSGYVDIPVCRLQPAVVGWIAALEAIWEDGHVG